MVDTDEVDWRYLWALETIAVAETRQESIGSDTEPVDQHDYSVALEELQRASLTQPRPRHPEQ